MTAVMDAETRETLDAVRSDHRPSRRDARRVIREAIRVVADQNAGMVHVADIRPLLPVWVEPTQIGATIAGLAASGHLVRTGYTRPYGKPSKGNAHKEAAIRKLVKPLTEEVV